MEQLEADSTSLMAEVPQTGSRCTEQPTLLSCCPDGMTHMKQGPGLTPLLLGSSSQEVKLQIPQEHMLHLWLPCWLSAGPSAFCLCASSFRRARAGRDTTAIVGPGMAEAR